jgi:hypothetical protein
MDGTDGVAEAGPSGEITLAQAKDTDLRAQRAIKQATFAWNLVAKYVAEPGQRIGAREPKGVRQDAGVGGGLPREVIADGAIDSAKFADGAIGGQDISNGAVGRRALSEEVSRALPRWVVKVDNNMGVPVTCQSSPAISMSWLATGTCLADFGEDISSCSWTATPSIDSGVPDAQTARTMPVPGGLERF